MYFKGAIFTLTSTLLVLAIYSSSTNFVSAETRTACYGTSKTTTTCIVSDTETGDSSVWDCKKNKDGKTWSCEEHKTITARSISPTLDNALDAAIKGNSQITTNVPNLQDLPQLQSTNNSTN